MCNLNSNDGVSLKSLKFKPILLGRGVPRVKINKGIVN